MPSANNLSDNSINGNPHRPDGCPFCYFNRIWKHGSYKRNGFHEKIYDVMPEGKNIQRYLCKSPFCSRTFSELHEEVLPYCRFYWTDFLRFFCLSFSGKNAYSIWKENSLASVSIPTFYRLIALFKKALVFVKNTCREMDISISGNLKDMCSFLLESWSWFRFTSHWYHAIYPGRLWQNENPHNS